MYVLNEKPTTDLSFLIEQISHLDGTDLDKLFEAQHDKIKLFTELNTFCSLAYEHDNQYCMTFIQKLLFKIYNLYLNIPSPGSKNAESSFIVEGVRNLIENQFIKYEEKLISPSIWKDIPVDGDNYVKWLSEIIQNHQAYKHPFYEDYLNKHATLDDLRYFLVQESTIDTRFDDFLALVQVGTDGGIKLEIASNYWDEMGNGEESKMHTVMFSRTMSHMGNDSTAFSDDLTPEALICGNLSLMLSLRRNHFYKAIGYFAATEYMTPRRFKNVVAAWQKNNLELSEAEYYKEHIRIDAIHANNWFKNVVSPIIDKNPDAAIEITRGALYRLNTSKRYLDVLLSKFTH
jgi:pyrroloquinoline quinone (PQQ) biosynthesis protein C